MSEITEEEIAGGECLPDRVSPPYPAGHEEPAPLL